MGKFRQTPNVSDRKFGNQRWLSGVGCRVPVCGHAWARLEARME
jgi:hypothetical protein